MKVTKFSKSVNEKIDSSKVYNIEKLMKIVITHKKLASLLLMRQ